MTPYRGFLPGLPGADNPRRPDNWRDGKNLPHWNGNYVPQSLTFRLFDSVPKKVIVRWKQELKREKQEEKRKILSKKIEKYSDRGYGKCWLENPEIAKLTQDSLLHFDGERYVLHAWSIMPNHVHVLITLLDKWKHSEIMHSWRSFTANKANQLLNRRGTFWADDYFDRFIRNAEHFGNEIHYIEKNPVNAGLCKKPEGWKWGSAYFKDQGYF